MPSDKIPMPKSVRQSSRSFRLHPGASASPKKVRLDHVKITVIDYDENHLEEKEVQSIEECFAFKNTDTVSWINIDGLSRVDLLEKLDAHFNIHPLVLEDIVNTNQHPKFHDYENYLYVVLKMLYLTGEEEIVTCEQVSFLIGPNYVLSFQEKEGVEDVFDPIRERIRAGKGRIRRMGADYLAYCLLDAVVDSYFVILERTETHLDRIEERLLDHFDAGIAQEIHLIKRDVIFLRKNIWPLREIISGLQRSESKIVKKTTGIYLRDVYDHTIQVMDTIESLRDTLGGMHDIYLSNVSNRMNEIMKVLTIFSTIFIPLTFIAGIYGMNFEFMPELRWRYGYFVLLGLMATVAVGLLAFFKRKKWI